MQLKLLNKLILFSAFANSYIIYFLFVPNGGEGFSIIFVLLALVYLLRKKSVSGLFFGLAGLAKYPSLILFPLVLFLGDKKKILKAIAFEILTVLAWGAIDYFLYGIPFYSYFESAAAAGIISGPSVISILAVVQVLAYPIGFAAIGIVILVLTKIKFFSEPRTRKLFHV